MNKKINPSIYYILSRLEEGGYSAYLVGGAVRDIIRGEEADDFDIATSASPSAIKEIFKNKETIDKGIDHGTVSVIVDDLIVEITTYRIDGTYADKRHPDEVIFTDKIEEDLARRDFTINAIAFSPERGIVDPYGGRRDIEKRLIRCVGDPYERFDQDGLRILRALRFASVLGFDIEENTAKALRSMVSNLHMISEERNRDELVKLLTGARAGKVLMAFPEVIFSIIPELEPCWGLDQRNPHHAYDVYEHIVRTLAGTPADPEIRLAALLHDIGKAQTFTVDDKGIGHCYGHAEASEKITVTVMKRLCFPKKIIEHVAVLVAHHGDLINPDEKSVRRAMNKFGQEVFFDLLELKKADNKAQHPKYLYRQKNIDKLEEIGKKIIEEDDCFSLASLKIGGKDLIEIGFEEGILIGEVLDILLDEVIEGSLDNDKDKLLARALELKDQIKPI